jgi:hypothetical protein
VKVFKGILLDVWKLFSSLNVFTVVCGRGLCMQVMQKLVEMIFNVYTVVCGRGLCLQVMQKLV